MVGGLEQIVTVDGHRARDRAQRPPPRRPASDPFAERTASTPVRTRVPSEPWRIKLHWRKSETHGLLPDPDPRPIRHTLVLHRRPPRRAAAHVRGPAARQLQADAPQVVETEEGHEVWQFDGKIFFQVGLNAVVGRKTEDWKVEPTRFEEMRPGCYDIDARVRDMDINGVWASVNFPSQITGFCGSVFSRCSDPDLGLAVTQAWNDWFYDEWYSPHPDRIVPMGITYLARRRAGRRRRSAATRRAASPR